MKKGLIHGMAALTALALTVAVKAYALPLAEARAQIGDVVAEPDKATEIVKQLTPEDQLAFVGDVNAAIAKLSGSSDEKAAKALTLAKAALKGVAERTKADPKEKNMTSMLAEIIATAPIEALTTINEALAREFFNRGENPNRTYTDEQYTNVAWRAIDKVVARNVKSDSASVRDTFAILLFVRASNGTPTDLASVLSALIPDEREREMAINEWIPSALNGNYEPMLAYADAARQPSQQAVIRIIGPELHRAYLDQLALELNIFDRTETARIFSDYWNNNEDISHSVEPRGYQGQRLH